MSNKPLRIKCLSFLAGLPFLVYLVQSAIFFANSSEGFGYDEYWQWASKELMRWMSLLVPVGGIGLVLSRGLYNQRNWARIFASIVLGIWGTWFAWNFYGFARPTGMYLMAGAYETYAAEHRKALLMMLACFVLPMSGGVWFLSIPSTRKLFH